MERSVVAERVRRRRRQDDRIARSGGVASAEVPIPDRSRCGSCERFASPRPSRHLWECVIRATSIDDLVRKSGDICLADRVDLDDSPDAEWSKSVERLELGQELVATTSVVSMTRVANPVEETAHGDLRRASTPELDRIGQLSEPLG